MIFPSITEYRDALRFDGALKKYKQLELVKYSNGEPQFSAGNFAVVFRMQDKITGKTFAVKCFTRDQERRQKSYALISQNLSTCNSPYLVQYEYLPDEVWVNSTLAGDKEYPAVIMEWIESKTLGEILTELCIKADKPGIFALACAFDQLALWLLEQSFAHGDLKTDNILVESNGNLRLIDYDGMFTPEMAGEKARENGSPGFRHPRRSIDHFGPHIDDFSILLISLSLHALAENPGMNGYHNFGDAILFDEKALTKPGEGKVWETIETLRLNNEVSHRLVMLYMAAGNPAEMRLFGMKAILKVEVAKVPKPKTKGLQKLPQILDYHTELPELIPFRKGNKWGFCDRHKKIIITPNYSRVQFYSEGLAAVMLNGKWGFINNIGQISVPIKYDNVLNFNDGMAAFSLDLSEKLGLEYTYSLWGYVDKTGREIIPLKFDNAWNFKDGMARVKMNNKDGYIDKTGREILPFKYKFLCDFKLGLAAVELNFKSGLIDRTGLVKIPLKYDSIGLFREKLWSVKLNGKFGFIDTTGRELVPLKFDVVNEFSEDLCSVKLNGKYGFIDKSGREIIPFKYDFAGSFIDKLCVVRLNDKYGFIDKTGRELIPIKYESARNFSEKLVSVKMNGKWGFINKTDQLIIPFIYDPDYDYYPCYDYDYDGTLKEGLRSIKLNGKWGYIDESGKEIIPFKYESANPFYEGLASIRLNGSAGYINKSGLEYWEN